MRSSPKDPKTEPVPDSDPLGQAAQRLYERLLPQIPRETDPACLRREIDAVATTVRGIVNGRDQPGSGLGELDRLHLLRHLRGEVLDAWPERNGSLLPLMRAFQRTEQDWSQRYGGQTISYALTPFSRNLLREVAHLLRSPMGSIVVMADSLCDPGSGVLEPTQQRRVDIMRKAALSASTITSDLLALLSEEQRAGDTARFRVAETLDDVGSLVRPVAEARNTDLMIRCGDQQHRLGPVRGLSQVLLTLLLRAALMTRDASLTINVVVESDDDVRFEVVTDGNDGPIEFGRDDSGAFFLLDVEPHSRVMSLSPDGLGLQAAQQILRSMGSDLRVQATPRGDFSISFSLELPIAG